MLSPFKKLSNERSDKFSWILTLPEVISIRILRMRIFSTIMNFYWSHAIALQKLSNERSYKFSWILTLTEVISIRSLAHAHNLIKREVSREKLKSPVKNYSRRRQTTDKLAFQYSRLWVNNLFFFILQKSYDVTIIMMTSPYYHHVINCIK